MTKIEHANITVPDIDEAIAFIKIVAPDFNVRTDQSPPDSHRWAHIGNDDFYFALQQAHVGSSPEKLRTAYKNYGVNHIALVVDNLDEIEKRLVEADYPRSIDTPAEKHRKRLYFLDKTGFEWELIEYLSKKLSEKFLYE